MEKAAGATASKETYPVGRRESVKHWFFKGRQRPPANPPDTGQSRSDCPLCRPPEGFTTHSKKQRPRGAFMRLTGTLQNVVSKARRPLRRVRGPWRCTRRPVLPGKSLRLTPSQRQRGFSCPIQWIPSPPSVPPAHGCGAPSAPSAAPWCGFSHCPGRRCR